MDAIVTDPPYGLTDLPMSKVTKALQAWMDGDRSTSPSGRGMMGRDWDRFVPPPAVWDECLRVLKPGGARRSVRRISHRGLDGHVHSSSRGSR